MPESQDFASQCNLAGKYYNIYKKYAEINPEFPSVSAVRKQKAVPRNPLTKIMRNFFSESVNRHQLFTAYRQYNGVTCWALRAYNEPIHVNQTTGLITNQNMRLLHMEVHMDGLNLQNQRCWDTKGVTGMLKRYGGRQKNDSTDSNVTFHLCPSRGGANAGNAYANAVMTSSYYNVLEKSIWSTPLQKSLGESSFSMTVESQMGPIVPKNPKQFFEDMNRARKEHNRGELDTATQDKLLKRFQLVEQREARAYRVEKLSVTVFLPPTVSPKDLQAIETEPPRKLKVTTDQERKSATFTFPVDYDILCTQRLH